MKRKGDTILYQSWPVRITLNWLKFTEWRVVCQEKFGKRSDKIYWANSTALFPHSSILILNNLKASSLIMIYPSVNHFSI